LRTEKTCVVRSTLKKLFVMPLNTNILLCSTNQYIAKIKHVSSESRRVA